jgi:hypothetical protein
MRSFWIRGFLLWACLATAGFARAQVLRPEYLAYEFDTTGFGFDTPDQLGRAFFRELQTTRDLDRFFSTIEVYKYMVVHAGMKHGKTVLKATEYYWQQFESERRLYCRQLLDNLDSRQMDMTRAVLKDLRFDVERVNDSDVMASDIELLFDYEGDTYSILLDDCGQVKGKWFLMTPYVLWQGKQSAPANEAGQPEER